MVASKTSKLKMKRITIAVAVVITGFAFQSQALTWLGYFDGNGNGTFPTGQPSNVVDNGGDTEAAVENALAFIGRNNNISLLGKSDSGLTPLSGFSSTPGDLVTSGGILSGSVSYSGSENISYITFKVGNVNGGQTAPLVGYHLYAWAGGGSFNLLTDPNPDFTSQGNSVSHYSVWSSPTTNVPDGGSTLALVGLAIAGLGLARRKLS